MNLFRNEITKEGVAYTSIATLMLVAIFGLSDFHVLLKLISCFISLLLLFIFYRIQVMVNIMTETRDNLEKSFIANTMSKNRNDLEKSFIGDRHHMLIQTTIADLVVKEPPQAIATILANLGPDMAASILNLLPESLRNDVFLHIATIDKVQVVDLHSLEDLEDIIPPGNTSGLEFYKSGVCIAADILSLIGSTQNAVLESMRDHDLHLAQKVMDNMFVFENLMDIEDRGIQLILREVQSESLIVALKGASEELRDKILGNMSQRAAEMLREDLVAKGPIKLSEVAAEQKEILKIVRRLSNKGQVSIGSNGDEAYI